MSEEQREPYEIREPYKSAMSAASDADRQHFERYPDETDYVRSTRPYEIPDWDRMPFVHVVQFEPGVRTRLPMKTPDDVRRAAQDAGLTVWQFAQALPQTGQEIGADDEVWDVFK